MSLGGDCMFTRAVRTYLRTSHACICCVISLCRNYTCDLLHACTCMRAWLVHDITCHSYTAIATAFSPLSLALFLAIKLFSLFFSLAILWLSFSPLPNFCSCITKSMLYGSVRSYVYTYVYEMDGYLREREGSTSCCWKYNEYLPIPIRYVHGKPTTADVCVL